MTEVRPIQRAPEGTSLALASYEELVAEIIARKPTGHLIAIAYPTNRPGREHSGAQDLLLDSRGAPPILHQLCGVLAEHARITIDDHRG